MTAIPLKKLTFPSSEKDPPGYLPSLYLARLMSPTEVAHATRDHEPEVRTKLLGRWMLCGDVNSRMFSGLKKHPERLMFRISGFRSTMGGPYAVLTHQQEEQQHRFLLALYDSRVIDWLSSMEREDYGFLLGNNEASDAVVLVGAAPAAHFRPLRSMCVDPAAARGLLPELSIAAAAIGALDAIPSLDARFKVTSVSESVLLPDPLVGGHAAMESTAH